jgi:hydroxymethylglutaryl-CoA lyase
MTKILVSEVGPRDGLQSTSRIMPLEAKKAWIKAEAEAGVREIEVGSFVPPSLLPQMADTAEVVAFAKTINGLNVVALVPNAQGAARAAEAGVAGAQYNLGYCYRHGEGVAKDAAKSVEWWTRAAKAGQADAQRSLGSLQRGARST